MEEPSMYLFILITLSFYASIMDNVMVLKYFYYLITIGYLRHTINIQIRVIFSREGWKVHAMMSYLLLMNFLTNEIQALQHQRGPQWGLCLKINLIQSHSMSVSFSAYRLFRRSSYHSWFWFYFLLHKERILVGRVLRV